MHKKEISLDHLLKAINLPTLLKKKQNHKITNIADLVSAKTTTISFFSNIKYQDQLQKSKASAILTTEKYKNLIPKKIVAIVCKNPEIEFIKVANFFYPDSYFSKVSNKNLNSREIKKKFKTSQ